jgi:DNA-binding transcriptional ArsR family regulator
MEAFKQQANLFKILMHPARLAILSVLRSGEECVCHMEALLGYRQAYISQQLSVLREAGLVQDRRDGWNIYYRVVRPEIYLVLDQAEQITGAGAGFPALNPYAPGSCPCPKCQSTGGDPTLEEGGKYGIPGNNSR